MNNVFLDSTILIFLYVSIWFIVGVIKKDNGIMDIAWGLGFLLISIWAYYFYGTPHFIPKLTLILIAIWGIRLSTYILIRNSGQGEDFRYANWRQEWGKWVHIRAFFQVYLLQGAIMWIIALPLMFAAQSPISGIGIIQYLGLLLFTIGFFFEAVGDAQMYAFKSKAKNKGKIMDTGLWAYTRHPNYFGESLIWWGIFLLTFSTNYWYWSIISPILITFLLLKVSGVSMLERKYDKNDIYQDYKSRVNAFIPWFPQKD